MQGKFDPENLTCSITQHSGICVNTFIKKSCRDQDSELLDIKCDIPGSNL